jgi:NAD+ kinase
MRRVGLVVHPTRPVSDAVEVLRRWTGDRGLELVQIPAGDQPPVAPAGEVSACDLTVAIGGDGTILKALHVSARTRTPVLGVAYGSLGALTSVPTDELRAGLDRFASGDWTACELPALAIRAAEAELPSAINDVVVARSGATQLLLDVYVQEELYARLAGDGVVLATPLGSSAYSMAAGGALLASGADSFLLTPLAMHGGCAPPLVVARDGEVRLEVNPGHTPFYLSVDGYPVQTDARTFSITCERSYAALIALDDSQTGLARLRARGLISDSPRFVGQDRLRARIEPAE